MNIEEGLDILKWVLGQTREFILGMLFGWAVLFFLPRIPWVREWVIKFINHPLSSRIRELEVVEGEHKSCPAQITELQGRLSQAAGIKDVVWLEPPANVIQQNPIFVPAQDRRMRVGKLGCRIEQET